MRSTERMPDRPRVDAGDRGVSLYVHTPYCVVKCGYCDFNSFEEADPAAHRDFVEALALEIEARAPRRPVTVFVGGGTPTYLDREAFERLFAVLHETCRLGDVVEVTMEANPESVDADKARIARDAGVGRVSLGVQTFDAEGLRFLDRTHRPESVAAAVATFRAAGFDNLSLDLIYGWPGQSLDRWERDLDLALALEPDHLSCYALTFEPGTKLTARLRSGEVEPIDADEERRMFEATHARLRSRGFEAYEVSNFAGRGGPSRHNEHYWLQGNYVGVGPGAASHEDGWRGTNLKPVAAWAAAVRRGLSPTGEAEILGRRARAAEAVWLGLRRTSGVDLARIGQRVGWDAESGFADELARAVREGVLERRGSVVRLTAEGRPFADEVGARFLST